MATDWLIAIPALLHASGGASSGMSIGDGALAEVALVVLVTGLGVGALPWRSGDHAAVARGLAEVRRGAVGFAAGLAAGLAGRLARGGTPGRFGFGSRVGGRRTRTLAVTVRAAG